MQSRRKSPRRKSPRRKSPRRKSARRKSPTGARRGSNRLYRGVAGIKIRFDFVWKTGQQDIHVLICDAGLVFERHDPWRKEQLYRLSDTANIPASLLDMAETLKDIDPTCTPPTEPRESWPAFVEINGKRYTIDKYRLVIKTADENKRTVNASELDSKMVLELLEQLHLTASQIGPAKELLLQQSKLGTTGEHDDDAVREYLKAHCCYLQSMFKPVVFPTVGCFVDKYAKDKPEQKRLALKIMLTSYVDTWRRVQREMREANANMQKRIKSDPQYQKKINDLNSDKSKQGKLGALTAGKLGMIGYEVVHALVHHSLTDLAGAASLLKVTEAGGLHVVATSTMLTTHAATSLLLSGALSTFGVVMLGRTVVKEVAHLRHIADQEALIQLALTKPNSLFQRFETSEGSILGLPQMMHHRKKCSETSAPGCVAKSPPGCYWHWRDTTGEFVPEYEQIHGVAGWEICQ